MTCTFKYLVLKKKKRCLSCFSGLVLCMFKCTSGFWDKHYHLCSHLEPGVICVILTAYILNAFIQGLIIKCYSDRLSLLCFPPSSYNFGTYSEIFKRYRHPCAPIILHLAMHVTKGTAWKHLPGLVRHLNSRGLSKFEQTNYYSQSIFHPYPCGSAKGCVTPCRSAALFSIPVSRI